MFKMNVMQTMTLYKLLRSAQSDVQEAKMVCPSPRKWYHAPGGFTFLYFVWYRCAAGIVPIFQVIYTLIGHDFISNIHL